MLAKFLAFINGFVSVMITGLVVLIPVSFAVFLIYIAGVSFNTKQVCLEAGYTHSTVSVGSLMVTSYCRVIEGNITTVIPIDELPTD